MKRISITLILSAIVFVATLVATNMYVSQKSIENADYINDIALDNFQSELNSDILLTEQSVRSFLTGFTSLSLGNDSASIIVEEKELPEFMARIHENLSGFMMANKYYMNSMFIIDRDICRDFLGRKECYVPSVKHGNPTLHDLSGEYDFMSSKHYQKVKTERKPFWTTPSATSPVAGKYMTLYVPLSLGNGRFFGTFAVSLDINMLNDKLQEHLPYGNDESSMFLVDQNGCIFSASHDWLLDTDFQNNYKKAYGEVRTNISDSDYQKIDYDGKKYYIYQRKNLLAPWKIYTCCETDAIYKDAQQFNSILFATSFVGMLLMLICCVVVSRQIRKNLLLKAAAEDELKMAAKVQMSLLKKPQATLGNVSLQAYMKPAREAGGDLYDYIEKEGKVIFCIGDVSGKGMAAALFMTQVVSLFRSVVATTSQPEVITSRINDVLAQNNQNMTFCTFFVGVLSDRKLTWCNAGHNPPVLLTDGADPQFLKIRPNLALGLIEGYPYKSETMDFTADNSLTLYTDGITEAKNTKHEEYGEERLVKALHTPAVDVIASVIDDVHLFVGNYEQSDDITLVHVG